MGRTFHGFRTEMMFNAFDVVALRFFVEAEEGKEAGLAGAFFLDKYFRRPNLLPRTMRPLLQEIQTPHPPESLVEKLRAEPGLILLRSNFFDSPAARYSFVTARPFLVFKSFGSRCELSFAVPQPSTPNPQLQFGNPWHMLDALMSRYELLDEIDLPFPLGGCFGYWGYDLKNFVEPKLPRRAVNDLELPDCCVGFYDSLVVFDHRLDKTWIISTGVESDGSRNETKARAQQNFWREKLADREEACVFGIEVLAPDVNESRVNFAPAPKVNARASRPCVDASSALSPSQTHGRDARATDVQPSCTRLSGEKTFVSHNFCRVQPGSTLSRAEFISKVERAQRYIRAGDIYQVNLSHRLEAAGDFDGWEFFQNLSAVSPAPFSAYLDCGDFQIASSSPESFLQMSGAQIRTRPIKGTRPRSADSNRDAQLTYELQTSAKEMAELVMITDLLRNDLGKVCEYGSVQVPELVRLERFPQVQHLVSTIEGRLRNDVTHFAAFASSFPGGSITGAPKIRAMEIIDELEPITRGPYTGALGYLGFNRESQLSITIRAAICQKEKIYFNVGAGIVADSNPEAEYEETLAKARGFFEALEHSRQHWILTQRRKEQRRRELVKKTRSHLEPPFVNY